MRNVLVLVGLLVATAPAEGQVNQPKQGAGEKRGYPPAVERPRIETESELMLWKQKAELEIERLQARIEATRAEIKEREAEFRLREVTRAHALLAKLEEPISMSFANETPLEDVLKYIKSATQGPDDTGLPIYVDPDGLQKAQKTMTSPVALDLEGVPLKTTLRLLLKQLGLSYSIKDGLLVITSEH
jgi:hypothetical protein